MLGEWFKFFRFIRNDELLHLISFPVYIFHHVSHVLTSQQDYKRLCGLQRVGPRWSR